jgi:glycosyltransferase involved in cell wall biosynthesis
VKPRGPIQLAPREIVYEAGDLASARVTVCITLYNYAAFVIEALESVYAQTLRPLAVVVVDDGSRDDGAARVERWMRSYGGRFAGVRLARNVENAGLARARNGAIDLAESPYVMVLDADNLLYPRCVARLAESLEGSPYAFAFSILERFGEHRGLMGTTAWDPEHLKLENYVDAMAMLRKSTWEQLGGYERMQTGGWEDYDFWCKCVEADLDGLLVPEILARYRVHGVSMLATETNRLENARRVRAEMRDRHPWLQIPGL